MWCVPDGTCGSDPQPYNAAINLDAARGKILQVAIPTMYPPAHYKTTVNGTVCTWNSVSHDQFKSGFVQAALSECDRLLYDNTVSWEGYVVDFLRAVAKEGDISLEFIYSTTAARWAQPGSEWTAAVRDVQYGMADFGGGVFWVTQARSAMAAFSTELGAFH